MTTPRTILRPPGRATSIQDQINLLIQRGMAIPDRGAAGRILSHVNFYRMRGYWEPFVDRTIPGNRHNFQAGTTFDAVVERYNFDRQLRTLLLDGFNHIEVSIRTQWTYHLAYGRRGGPSAHWNRSLFSNAYDDNLLDLHRSYGRHGQRVHRYDYASCPIWAIAESMSFGQLSRWYGDTTGQVRQQVARTYGLDERILGPLLRHLVPIRNICAHHERLWGRDFITRLTVPRRLGQYRRPRSFFNPVDTAKVYNALVMIAHLTKVITDNSDWAQNLVTLMNRHGNIPQSRMASWLDGRTWTFGNHKSLRNT